MSLRDEALSHGRNYQKFPLLLEALGDEADEFKELLADPLVPPNGLYHALQNRFAATGDERFDIGHGAVHRWCQNARRPK